MDLRGGRPKASSAGPASAVLRVLDSIESVPGVQSREQSRIAANGDRSLIFKIAW